jgi:hypothetical protein
MPKRREPALAKEAQNTPTPAQIEAFAAGADSDAVVKNILDSEQNRDTAQQQKAESPVVEPIASINR